MPKTAPPAREAIMELLKLLQWVPNYDLSLIRNRDEVTNQPSSFWSLTWDGLGFAMVQEPDGRWIAEGHGNFCGRYYCGRGTTRDEAVADTIANHHEALAREMAEECREARQAKRAAKQASEEHTQAA